MSDFEHLNDEQRADAMMNAARAALTAWGWHDVEPRLLGLRSNAVYRAERGGQQAVVRVHWPGRKSSVRIESELAVLDDLTRRGISVPKPLAEPVRVALTDRTPALCTLLAWQDGESVAVDRFTPEHASTAGKAIAALHVAARTFDPPAGFDRPTLDIEGLFGANSPYQPDAAGQALLEPVQDVLDAVIERTKAVFDRQRASGAVMQLIHADLKPDNLLFDADRVGFLDFDDCAWGWPLYDLAPMLLFLRANPAYAEIKTALWEGFSGRALDAVIGADLETLAAARYATSCRWVAMYHDHPSYRGKAPGILAGRASELRRYIERGAL